MLAQFLGLLLDLLNLGEHFLDFLIGQGGGFLEDFGQKRLFLALLGDLLDFLFGQSTLLNQNFLQFFLSEFPFGEFFEKFFLQLLIRDHFKCLFQKRLLPAFGGNFFHLLFTESEFLGQHLLEFLFGQLTLSGLHQQFFKLLLGELRVFFEFSCDLFLKQLLDLAFGPFFEDLLNGFV